MKTTFYLAYFLLLGRLVSAQSPTPLWTGADRQSLLDNLARPGSTYIGWMNDHSPHQAWWNAAPLAHVGSLTTPTISPTLL